MSGQKTKKKKSPEERQSEIQAAKALGRHVSPEKGRLLLAVTMIACALPVLLGLRLWDQIPEMVETGLIGPGGQDDSLPRWAVVFVIPGLMCLLNFICHMQLRVSQRRMTVPSRQVRLVGRWGFPLISVLFCSGLIQQSAGGVLTLNFFTPRVLGLALLLLGAHMWDCPRTARVALRFSVTERSEPAWQAVHKLAGRLWLAVGLAVIAAAMLTTGTTAIIAVAALAALLAPVAYGYSRRNAWDGWL